MRFAIVDHDTNYFTKPEQLENVYGRIWDEVPISLSVVPFHASTKSGAIPREYWQGDRIFPIGENKELVKFLKRKISENKVSILMHGYSHKDYENGYEFEVGEGLYEKVKEGKKYLEETFGVEIKTFIPPHNSLSKEGMKAVIANRLNILGSLSFRPSRRPFEVRYIFNLFRRKFFQLKSGILTYPMVLQFKGHCELACFSLIPSTRMGELIRAFNLIRKYNANFCLATHHWEMSAKMKNESGKTQREIFEDFLKFVEGRNGIVFSSIDRLFLSK